MNKLLSATVAIVILSSCQSNELKQPVAGQYATGTFGYDLDFLRQKDSILILNSKDGNGQVIVSPKYQAKVFTSTANGVNGKSFGWINYKAFSAKSLNPHMNAYGGEDRLWLGPEGGKFALFFNKGAKMEIANWHTPAAFDNEEWKLVSHTDKKASLTKFARLVNYKGTILTFSIGRVIQILEPEDIIQMLGINMDTKISSVAFSTINTITNKGDKVWDKQSGMCRVDCLLSG